MRSSEYFSHGNVATTIPERQVEREKQRRVREKEAMQNYRRAVEQLVVEKMSYRKYTPMQVVSIATSVVAMLAAAFVLIMSSSLLRDTRRQLSDLKYQYYHGTQENRLIEDAIESRYDLSAVYDYAVHILGMQTPKKHQIIYYDAPESEYVLKIDEIPTK